MGQSLPFRGSTALARELLTPAVLYGPRYKRLFPDIHVTADAEEDLTQLSMAAHELVAPHGVLAGYSAAEILGASCAPLGAPAEVVMIDGHRRRSTPRLTVRRDEVDAHDLATVRGMRLTTPAATAAHLARWAPSLTEAVVAVDALAHRYGLDPAAVVTGPAGARRMSRLPDVIRLAEPLSESPMETRIRLAIVFAALPLPVSQHPVVVAGRSFRLDLAYPELMLAIEYNGREHLTPERADEDLVREQLLVAAGWRVLRFRAGVVLRSPSTVAATVAAERRARGSA